MDQGEIGDRGALGITTLLTEVFLLQYTNDSMPRVSYVKAADLFLIVSFAFTFLALLESVIVYNFKRKSENGQGKNITGGRTFFRKHQIPLQEVPKSVSAVNGAHTNPVTLSEAIPEAPIPLQEPQVNKNLWEKPNDDEEKVRCPVSTALTKGKIQRWFTSFKSYLAKRDRSYFIEMCSRILFPVMYIGFIGYFFEKYGV